MAKTCSIGLRSGEYFGRNTGGPDGPDRLPDGLSFVRAEIVEDDDVAWFEGRNQELLDVGEKALAVDGSVEQAGRLDAIVAQGGEESRGLPVPVRDLVDQPLPFGAQPRRRVMLVFVQVSSIKTRRLGSIRP